ncbi:MAG TPA: nicotinate (nicotinamide) nucleotide adenylyltransferase [Segetibacter sp.]|jgi:nicotinate-nucleotide adenylyltransferase
MKIGLYFGSFNPVHIGHLIIADFVANNSELDKVWLVVSPQNPLKPSSSLLNEYHRLHLARLATEDNSKLHVSNIEFKLPRPSYTIDTLVYLREKYPQHTFSIIFGSDSYQNISKWKNYETLLRDYSITIYERPGFPVSPNNLASPEVLKAPLLDISSTFIREMIKSGKSIKYLVPEEVRLEIENHGYFLELKQPPKE